MSSEERARIFRLNIERLELAYELACERGLVAPIALVLDLRDESARHIAATWQPARTDQHIQAVTENDPTAIPTLVAAVKESEIDSLLDTSRPTLRSFLNAVVPIGCFRTLVISGGVASGFIMQIGGRPD